MARGRFIALEGGEGSGKSTQARLLADALTARGLEVELTREPGGTPGAEAIRALLLDPPGDGWGAQAEALLFAAARADHVARRILPALENGQWVVCDRFIDSSRAYQGGASGLGDDTICALHAIGSGGLRPDLTLLIEIDPVVAAERVATRDGATADAIGGRDLKYHRAVSEAFGAISRRDPLGVVRIDGAGSPDEVHRRVIKALAPILVRQK